MQSVGGGGELAHGGLASLEGNNGPHLTFARDLMQVECWHFIGRVERW